MLNLMNLLIITSTVSEITHAECAIREKSSTTIFALRLRHDSHFAVSRCIPVRFPAEDKVSVLQDL